MCSIAGIIHGDQSKIYHMNDLMAHRGPDGRGVRTFEHGAFGHNRLSIIDLTSSGAQPMESDRYILTYNGEIYNYKELLSFTSAHDDLGNYKYPNDARALLNHIGKYEIKQALSDINGMYAFALYDKQTELVHIAVDRFGQKPLYYYHDNDFFAFASTPNALLWIKDKWKIDEEAIQSYWLLGGIMGENSIFSGIKRLNASEMATFDCKTGGFWKERYWEPKFQENISGIEDLVLDAIRKVKVSDVPVKVFLSGGVDSTLVASQCGGMGAIHLDGPERKYAEQVSSKFGLGLHVVDPGEFDPVEMMSDYVTKSGEPAMAALIPYIVSREASKICKVAITANGADELFFGYNRTRQGACLDQITHMIRHQLMSLAYDHMPNYSTLDWSSGRWYELKYYVQFDLNQTLDRAAMCHGLEVRAPFLDHRLVEMALSIPEKEHRNGLGNKSILKRMILGMGFDKTFVNRPKLGFSLFKEPKGLDFLQKQAFTWCMNEGFLRCDASKLSPRDRKYLEYSAFSFKIWFDVWKNILQ